VSATSGFRNVPFVDYDWPAYSARIGAEPLTVPLNPPGWKMELPAKAPGL
jgi:hypothetical protein